MHKDNVHSTYLGIDVLISSDYARKLRFALLTITVLGYLLDTPNISNSEHLSASPFRQEPTPSAHVLCGLAMARDPRSTHKSFEVQKKGSAKSAQILCRGHRGRACGGQNH